MELYFRIPSYTFRNMIITNFVLQDPNPIHRSATYGVGTHNELFQSKLYFRYQWRNPSVGRLRLCDTHAEPIRIQANSGRNSQDERLVPPVAHEEAIGHRHIPSVGSARILERPPRIARTSLGQH